MGRKRISEAKMMGRSASYHLFFFFFIRFTDGGDRSVEFEYNSFDGNNVGDTHPENISQWKMCIETRALFY